MNIYETYDKLPDSFLIGVKDVMVVLNISRTTVYRMITAGTLTRITVGSSAKFKVGEVRALANGTAPKLAEVA